MPKPGEVVMLKSGGPLMIINYVFKGGDGTKEKLAAMKGFGEGDCICEWQMQINEDNFKTKKETFKAAMLVYDNGEPLPSGGGGGDDDDDDDDDW